MVNEKETQLVPDDEQLEKQLSYEYRPGWYFVPEKEKQKRLEKLQKGIFLISTIISKWRPINEKKHCSS